MEHIMEPTEAGYLQRFYCPRHNVVLNHLDTTSTQRDPRPQVQLDCCKCPFTCIEPMKKEQHEDH